MKYIFGVVKVKAIILSFFLFVYLGETVNIPLSMESATKDGCCMKNSNGSNQKPDHCPLNNKKDNKKAMNCLDCPLCYITTFTPIRSTLTITCLYLETSYPKLRSNLISGYPSEFWKPPNPA